ncbi:DUF1642 domain-containing protein [Enterococcus faecalis]|nr:DUF1642 domain-containing protein [Enterococcus faecalis]EKJ3563612.1 DUF1642 domain-containing protein [Enterococcus faecalis]
MNNQEFVEKLESLERDSFNENYNEGYDQAVRDCLAVAKQLDEPKKVVVPQFVAEWIEKHFYLGKYTCLERFMCQYNKVKLPDKLYNYYDREHNAKDKIINAILNGYEVEKEQLYYVKIPLTEWNDDTSELETKYVYLTEDITSEEIRLQASNAEHGDWKVKLTEERVKSIDERYWPFAVKAGNE